MGVITRENQRLAYLQTEVQICSPEGEWLDATQASSRFGPLWVLSAWNPYSDIDDAEDNDARNHALRNDLAGLEPLAALGTSADGRWFEESFGVAGLGAKQARLFGRAARPARRLRASLVDVVEAHVGLELATKVRRFKKVGWRFDGETELPCDVCGEAVLRWPRGARVSQTVYFY